MQDEWSYADRLLGKLLNIFILYEFNVLQFRLNVQEREVWINLLLAVWIAMNCDQGENG
jgi:hypothetical protein